MNSPTLDIQGDVDLANKFWAKSVVDDDTGCLNWTGETMEKGYGKFYVTPLGRRMRAHRVAWALVNGDPGDMAVCQRCKNRTCVNPEHLFLANMQDARSRGKLRKTGPGEQNPRSVLTEDDVSEIRNRIAAGEGNMSIAEDYPISHSMVYLIRKNKAWNRTGTERQERINDPT